MTGWWAWPSILFAGKNSKCLAVLAFGYSAMQHAMTQDATPRPRSCCAIALGKILTTSLTIGSGGSGGVFGPSMVIGGCGGGALGIVLHQLVALAGSASRQFCDRRHGRLFCRRGQNAVFDAHYRERNDRAVTACCSPSLWVCTLSYILSDKQSIYSSQVESRSLSPAHQGSYVRQVLAEVRVSQFLPADCAAVLLRPGDPLSTVIKHLDTPRIRCCRWSTRPPTAGRGQPGRGTPCRPGAVAGRRWYWRTDLMYTDVRPLTPGDTLDRALELFVENDLMTLPVVDDLTQRRVIGMVRRFDVASAGISSPHAGPAEVAGG